MAAQNQELARHLGAGGVGIAPRRLRQLVLRIDAGIERLAHVPRADRRIVVAVASFDANLLGADVAAAACGQGLEGRAARLVGGRGVVNEPVREFGAESGDAGDGAGFRVDHRACLDRISAAGPAATAYVLSNP